MKISKNIFASRAVPRPIIGFREFSRESASRQWAWGIGQFCGANNWPTEGIYPSIHFYMISPLIPCEHRFFEEGLFGHKTKICGQRWLKRDHQFLCGQIFWRSAKMCHFIHRRSKSAKVSKTKCRVWKIGFWKYEKFFASIIFWGKSQLSLGQLYSECKLSLRQLYSTPKIAVQIQRINLIIP